MAKVSDTGKSGLKHKARAAKLVQVADKREVEGDNSKAVDPAATEERGEGGGGIVLYLGGALGAGSLAALAAGGAKDNQLQVFTPVLSANRPPILTLQSGTVTQQDQPVMAVFTASDPDGDPLIYSVTQGAHGSASIVAGSITYIPKVGYVGLDSVTATVSDGRGGEVSQTFTIQVRDNVAPKFTSPAKVEIAENIGADQVVYRAVASDASSLTYSLRSWDDAALFSIDAATGAVTLRENPDFERKSSYAITVVATDSVGSSSEQAVTIRVTDVFEDVSAPVFTSSAIATAINENSGGGQVIYTAVATDASTVSFSLKGVGDAAAFTINAATGAVTLIANPDYETKASYIFTVLAADAVGLSSEKSVTLNINNLNDGPIYDIPYGVLAQPVYISSFIGNNPTYKIDFTGISDISAPLANRFFFDPHRVFGGMNVDVHSYPRDLSLTSIADQFRIFMPDFNNSTAYIAFDVQDVDAITPGDQPGAAIVRYQSFNGDRFLDQNELNIVAVLPGFSVWSFSPVNFVDFV